MNKFALALSAICFFFFVNTAYGQWVQTSLSGKSVFALAVSGGNIFAGTKGGVFLSADDGTSWTAVNSGFMNNNVLSLAVSGSSIFAGTDGDGVFLTDNSGTHWTAVNSGLPANAVVRSFAVSGGAIYAGTDGGVFLSTNGGTSWTVINGPTITVNSFAVSESNIFAGTNGNGVYLCANNGASWTAVNAGLTNSIVFSLAVSGGNIFADTYSGGIFLSTNNGSSWTTVNSDLPKGDERPIFLSLAVSGSSIFAGAGSNSLGFGGGVFLSNDNGASWTTFNSDPFTYDTVFSLAVSGSNIFAGTGGSIFTGTSSSGVWRRPLSEMVSVLPQNQKTMPLQTRLRISASGSLHSGIILNYSIQSQCIVCLIIYTISGKQIAVLEEGTQDPGNYFVNLSNRIPAGLYVCRFQAGNYQANDRFVMAK